MDAESSKSGSESGEEFHVYRITYVPPTQLHSLSHILEYARHNYGSKIGYGAVKKVMEPVDLEFDACHVIRETCIAVMRLVDMQALQEDGCFAKMLDLQIPSSNMDSHQIYIPLKKIRALCPDLDEWQIKMEIKMNLECLAKGWLFLPYPKKSRILVRVDKKSPSAHIVLDSSLSDTTCSIVLTWLQNQYWRNPDLPPCTKMYATFGYKRKQRRKLECIQ
jgi:hypothetical protein